MQDKGFMADRMNDIRIENSSVNSSCTHSIVPMPKLEISMFDGKNPRWWVKRCKKFFPFYNIEESQKVNLASTYLNDAADAWF